MLDLCKIWIVYSLMPFTLICQSFDISIAAVASNYGGEMTDGLSSTLTHTHPGIGLGLKYRTGPVLSFELSAVFAHLSGDDKDLKDPILQLRNIHFRSNIREYAICTELNILPFFKDYPAIIEPYVNLGLGAMHFNPQAMYNGEWIDLQPLGTEGQGLSNFPEKYSLWTFVFFPSIGLRYNINEHWSCALELGFRKVIPIILMILLVIMWIMKH